MRNNYLRFVTILLFAVLTSVVKAAEEEAEFEIIEAFDFVEVNENGDTIWFKITSGNTCEVSCRLKYTYGLADVDDSLRYKGEIIIPSEVTHDGTKYSVKGIGKNAFYYCTQLTMVEIPSTVTYISDEAFGYTSISSVTLPASVKSLGVSPFYGCEKLTTIIVAEGNESFTVDHNVLFDKDMTTLLCYPAGLEQEFYIVPASVTIIESSSMAYSKLKEIKMTSVETIESFALENCYSLSKIDLPSCLKNIGWMAFSDDTLLTSITIPASVEDIGDFAFDGCINLQSINVANGNSYYTSDEGVLYTKDMETLLRYPQGKKDKEYTIDKNCKTISTEAFWENPYITKITLLEGLDSIEGWAFGRCTSLDSVYIPSTVRVLKEEGSIFYNTASLTSLEVDKANPYFVSVDNVIFSKDTTELFAYATGNEREFYSIPDGVKKIDYEAFFFYQHLKKIEIPASVDTIVVFAFACVDTICMLDTIVCKSKEPAALMHWEVFENEGENEYACYENTVLVVPDGAKEKYQSAEVWKLFKNIVEESDVTGINEINAESTPASVTKDDRIYDLQGRKLDNKPENGILYIKGGKKHLGI